ncbi:hypothetical protein [Paraburkholderia sp. ZP32-5]|uniref:hypothetical protein n=1 Tax=Paraburkholderia sp. ZP32-5 TaxID=2883245 RepID=UPI001F2CF76A|nr:hypothetical protein [Paraburkholderia sp. ZP32-5]
MSIQAVHGQQNSPVAMGVSTQAQQAAGQTQQASSSTTGSTASSSQPAAPQPSYTVKISAAAQALLAARAEANETSVQTAKEAAHGDQQAARLLAKEQARKAGGVA